MIAESVVSIRDTDAHQRLRIRVGSKLAEAPRHAVKDDGVDTGRIGGMPALFEPWLLGFGFLDSLVLLIEARRLKGGTVTGIGLRKHGGPANTRQRGRGEDRNST